jgi:hypothetical protein
MSDKNHKYRVTKKDSGELLDQFETNSEDFGRQRVGKVKKFYPGNTVVHHETEEFSDWVKYGR